MTEQEIILRAVVEATPYLIITIALIGAAIIMKS